LAHRSARIKALLLDQRFAAGVGNWIADEVLYQAWIDPRRRVNDLSPDDVKRLHRKLAAVIRTAVRVNADKAKFPDSWLFHRRWGRQRNATTSRGEPIRHIVVGGRSTAWVPSVQT
jgi:formamidopyrimidine-DNA glycosylase